MSSNWRQSGQALIEGLCVMLVLISLWVAIAWLGHLQDMALSAQHASRRAAFAYTRNPVVDTDNNISTEYLRGPAHQWMDRSGNPMLDSHLQQVRVHWDRASVLGQSAQPGGNETMAEAIRNSWDIQDRGMVNASVYALPGVKPQHADNSNLLGLGVFYDYPRLRRHTSILEGAGHASNDARVQHIVAQSALAWSDSAQASAVLGRKVDAAMAAVDAPWHRAHPVLDWLGPWAGHVPDGRLAYSVKEPS